MWARAKIDSGGCHYSPDSHEERMKLVTKPPSTETAGPTRLLMWSFLLYVDVIHLTQMPKGFPVGQWKTGILLSQPFTDS